MLPPLQRKGGKGGARASRPPHLAAPLTLALVLLAGEGQAAESDQAHVSLLTFSPDAHPFMAFGHSALWVHDPRMKGDDVDLVYNFGTFAFGSPSVIADFARGQLSYWLSIATLPWTVESYGDSGRTVRAQQIAMSLDEIDRLERALLVAARPENRAYAYGYIDNNCATRLRDALDQATGGAVRAAIVGPGAGAVTTHRAAIAHLLGDRPVFGAVIDAAMGPALDRRIDAWQAAFLPDRLASALAHASRATASGSTPLVVAERTLVDRARWFPEGEPGDRRPWALAIGVMIAGVMLAGRRDRRSLGVTVALLGALLGSVGVGLLLFGVIHPLARWNVNVLHASPFALGLVREGVRMARGQQAAAGRARGLAWLGLGASLVGLALSLTGATPQPVGAFAVLAVSVWAGLAAGLAATAQPGGGSGFDGGGGVVVAGVAEGDALVAPEGGAGTGRGGGGAP